MESPPLLQKRAACIFQKFENFFPSEFHPIVGLGYLDLKFSGELSLYKQF